MNSVIELGYQEIDAVSGGLGVVMEAFVYSFTAGAILLSTIYGLYYYNPYGVGDKLKTFEDKGDKFFSCISKCVCSDKGEAESAVTEHKAVSPTL